MRCGGRAEYVGRGCHGEDLDRKAGHAVGLGAGDMGWGSAVYDCA